VEFRIADTFQDSLARLTGDEQKAVKTTAFDLQLDPKNPGMKFHRLDKAKDKNFWSVRVSSDLRLIVHRTDASLLLCFVGHHDKAYEWASRRKLEAHPKTGAMQLVEIRETVQEVLVPVFVAEPTTAQARRKKSAAPVLAGVSDEELLGYGVPAEWLADVKAASEDSLLELADHLPAEAAEALLELATGGKPRVVQPATTDASPFDHPDAQRRFRVMSNVEELRAALDYPWEKWTVFLHPEQQQWVRRDFSGPARVAGSAGTGKTIVALHRAVHLARSPIPMRGCCSPRSRHAGECAAHEAEALLGNEPRLAERIDVHSFDALAMRLHKAQRGAVAARHA
jgi:mRNA-degrading endonuclease RelE of RelBE toxin-antitoxin system